jgi:hypothetical protein
MPTKLLIRLTAAALFAIGLLAATRMAPEWSTRETGSPAEAAARFDAVARRAGFEPTTARRRTDLALGPSSSEISLRREAAEQLGSASVDWLKERGLGLLTSVEASAVHSSGMAGTLDVSFDMNGDVASIEFTTNDLIDFVKPGPSDVDPDASRAVASLLLRTDESLGETETARIGAQTFLVFPVSGTDLPESITVSEPPGMKLVNRRPGTAEDIRRFYDDFLSLSHLATRGLSQLARMSIVAFFAVLFIVLLVRRSIGFQTSLVFGLLVLISSAASSLDVVGSSVYLWLRLGIAFVIAGWCVVVWSASESWLRVVKPDVLETIDTVTSFRPGPRSANAILDGWFAGLGLAGVLLLLESLPTRFGLIATSSVTIDLPVFGTATPLSGAVLLSGSILAAAAAAHYLRGRTEVVVALTLMTFIVFPSLRLAHWALTLIAALAVAACLRWLLVRRGAAAVLAASLNLLAAPAAIFAFRHLDWLPYSAAGASVLVFAPLLFVITGLGKPADVETQQIVTPGFMRRLSEERRVQYEMGLLAEMQLKMLPDKAPDVEGWDIAAQSVLASEVGGDLYDYLEDEDGNLWIAIGDVSGHGYQCAIAQAMTKASLTSLVSAAHTPSTLLARIDKVLRRGGSARTFTSLALAKINLASGRVIVSNAGNPYPVHVTADGRTAEIELPSLPLGMGPPRTYEDVELHLRPRDYLLFYSDGLVEVRNRNDDVLGFDKPAALVRMRRGQSAAEIVSGLEKAWRDHLGDDEVQDDTTIVLVRRA